MSQLVKIDSNLRINPALTSSSDFRIELYHSLEGVYSLVCASMPNSYYNISTFNNQLYFNDTIQNLTATIPPGFYDSSSLPSTIQSILNNVSSGFTVTYDNITSKMTISRSSNFTLLFSNSSNSIASTIGFANIDTTFSSSFQGSQIINLAPHQFFHIHLDVNTKYHIENAIGNTCQFVVPIFGTTKDITYYEPFVHSQVISFDRPTKVIRVFVTDKYNKIIPIQQDWSIILKKID